MASHPLTERFELINPLAAIGSNATSERRWFKSSPVCAPRHTVYSLFRTAMNGLPATPRRWAA